MLGEEASVSICQQHFPESAVRIGGVPLKKTQQDTYTEKDVNT